MNDTSTDKPKAIVIGAGIVGTCCAASLLREGFDVTLIDRDGPGEGCSSGNAGQLGMGSCAPFSLPDTWKRVPSMLLNSKHALHVPLSRMPALAPWFLHFIKACKPERVEQVADALNSLQTKLLDAYKALLGPASFDDLIRHAGRFYVYETPDWRERNAYSIDLRQRRGVELEELSGDEMREIEPALGPTVTGGHHMKAGHHAVNPLRLVKTIAEEFQSQGGAVINAYVRNVRINPDGEISVQTARGLIPADKVVVAAGAWSRRFAARMGAKVPLEAERGYHHMIADPGVSLKLSMSSPERTINLTPMEEGLRVTTGADFSKVDSAALHKRYDRILAGAKELLPGLNTEGVDRWMGDRPATPDGLPVIGPSPRNPNVLFAFGHGHLGLGLGAITGRVVSQLAAGKEPEVDVAPFAAQRF